MKNVIESRFVIIIVNRNNSIVRLSTANAKNEQTNKKFTTFFNQNQ